MNTQIFSVHDMAAGRYLDPFCAPTSEVAIRGFREACGTEGHQFAKFPEDYALYHIGGFDPELGVLELETPRKIAQATSYTQGFGNQLKLEEADSA